jgi:ethanolamine kinase
MADEVKARLIARNVAKWHRIEVPGEPSPRLFRTLRKWLAGVPKVYADPKINAQFQAGIDIKFIAEQLGSLEEKLGSLGSPVVFCHNDLLSANIIYQALPEPDVAFIDFEYGANNYRGFDIANHFCEWAGFECCFEEYPSKAQQMVWLHEYLATLKGGREPTELELESLYLEVNLFALVCNVAICIIYNLRRVRISSGGCGH